MQLLTDRTTCSKTLLHKMLRYPPFRTRNRLCFYIDHRHRLISTEWHRQGAPLGARSRVLRQAARPLHGLLTVNQKRISIKDIAEVAGVSHPTVSRALRGQGRMSETTRTRIVAIAQDMGYTPSLIARGLVTQRSFCWGWLFPPLPIPFTAPLSRALSRRQRAKATTSSGQHGGRCARHRRQPTVERCQPRQYHPHQYQLHQ